MQEDILSHFYTMALKDEEIKVELSKLAVRLKYFRLKRGYSNYEKFAFSNDISRTQYGRYEKGQDIRYSTLLKLLKALDVSAEEFFSEGFD